VRWGEVMRDRSFGAAVLASGIFADARRAVFLEQERMLVVADVHLGFAWTGRQRGSLLPVTAEDVRPRLRGLIEDYGARRCVFLGDTVHAPAAPDVVRDELVRLIEELSARCSLTFVRGNHDVRLPELLADAAPGATIVDHERAGDVLMVHGHVAPPESGPEESPARWVIYGHEHPAICVGDGVASAVKAPCFLTGGGRIVLPAFSEWAAGSEVCVHTCLSPLSRQGPFERAVAILGERLLPVGLA
jgi:putative SbcD/Mre11-related phosphoesterase